MKNKILRHWNKVQFFHKLENIFSCFCITLKNFGDMSSHTVEVDLILLILQWIAFYSTYL